MAMTRIDVVRQNSDTFEVTVKANNPTVHTVTVKDGYYQKLTGGKVSPERLIEKSFEFLLERESNTSILSRFDLTVIARYFPEYEQIIAIRL